MGIKNFFKKRIVGHGFRKKCLESIIDVMDNVYLKLYRKNIPPYSFRSHVGHVEDFEMLPPEYIAYFKLLCDLKMDHSILDIGCGPARFALQLLVKPHFFGGEYYGFDIDKKAIEWADKHVARRHNNFKFKHVDIENTYYNTCGKLQAETFAFPYQDEKFDFVFAISIFTHLLEESAKNYLQQINRVLKPGGKSLLTFFLLDGYPEVISDINFQRRVRQEQAFSDISKKKIARLTEPIRWHHHGSYSVLDPEMPERVVAYQRSKLKEMIEQSNLHLDKICYGSWNAPKDYLSLQDIVILSK